MSNFSEFFENMVNGGGYNRSANGKGFKISGKFGKFSPVKSIIISALITVVLAFIVFYFTLPALNFSNEQFYSFIIFHLIVFFLLYFLLSKKPDGEAGRAKKRLKVPVIVFLCIALVFAGGWIASAEIFNSSRYRDLITVEDGNFSEDVNEITFEQIPVLDKASAEKLGDRKLGELADMVSQFEVASDYIQIKLQKPSGQSDAA